MLLREDLVARLAVEPQRDLVRHRRRRNEDGLFLSQQLGSARLEPVDGRVLALLLVAYLGRGNRLAHARWAVSACGTKIDHALDCGG